ncbi:MAG: hypothetical protein IKA30_04520 [Alphaproteobacteria bacterium]|nr:hypothetical protein [Alphaproteobacteria bacterium]
MKSKILLSFVLMFAFIFSGCNTDEDMQAQYDLGYDEGKLAGYDNGYDDGFISGMKEAIEQSKESDEWFYDAWQVRTKETPLTLRKEPRSDAAKIAEIPQYEYVAVTDYADNGKWGFIQYGSVIGWINLDYCAYSYDLMVYVTDSGSKYHKEDCQHLKSVNVLPMKEAAALGYEACKVCGGYGIK